MASGVTLWVYVFFFLVKKERKGGQKREKKGVWRFWCVGCNWWCGGTLIAYEEESIIIDIFNTHFSWIFYIQKSRGG